MENGGTPTTTAELDKKVADVMNDIEKDVDMEVTEDDENDPELLAELAQITGGTKRQAKTDDTTERDTKSPVIVLSNSLMSKIRILKSRLEMYELAENAAGQSDEAGRARRFSRGIQTINEMLKKALAGDDINVEDIPPEVSMKNVQVPDGDEVESDK